MAKVAEGIKRVTVSLRPGDYETLRFVAFKRHLSISGLVQALIQELLEDEEDIRDGLKALKDEAETLDWETFKREHLGLQN